MYKVFPNDPINGTGQNRIKQKGNVQLHSKAELLLSSNLKLKIYELK